MASNSRQQLEDWLSQVEVKADSVLDVGGAKNLVKNRVKNWDVKEYKVLDTKPVDYVRDLNYIIDDVPEFDIIFCLEVTQYIWNPVQAFKNLNSFLKNKGILYISFHFFFPQHCPKGKDYLRYARDGIKKLLKETGFEIEEIIPRIAKNPKEFEKLLLEEAKIARYPSEVGYLVKVVKIRNGDTTP